MSSKKEVIKHSSAIHISNEISLLQRKAWNVLLANAFNDLPYKEVYAVSVRELAEVLKFDSKNLDYLKRALKTLNITQVEWNILKKDGKKEWGVFTLLAQANIINGICYYAYAPYLRKQLHNPMMYAKINLRLQNCFNSKHTLALYELAVDYYRIKDAFGETPFITVEDLRRLLGLKDSDYPQFKILSRDIIKKAIKEINSKSDLLVDIEYRRKGRKVNAIKFRINKNPDSYEKTDMDDIEKKLKASQNKKPGDGEEIDNQELFKRLTIEFGISTGKSIEILKTKDEFYITEVLEFVKDRIDKGKVKDIPAFTVKALEKDYRAKKSRFLLEKDKTRQKILDETHNRILLDKLKTEYEKYSKTMVDEVVNNLTDSEKEKLIQDFEEKVIDKRSPFLKRRYQKSGIESAGVQSFFQSYVAEQFLPKETYDFVTYSKSKGYQVNKDQDGNFVLISNNNENSPDKAEIP